MNLDILFLEKEYNYIRGQKTKDQVQKENSILQIHPSLRDSSYKKTKPELICIDKRKRSEPKIKIAEAASIEKKKKKRKKSIRIRKLF